MVTLINSNFSGGVFFNFNRYYFVEKFFHINLVIIMIFMTNKRKQ